MITLKLDDKEYIFKNTLDDITIKDYFELSAIMLKKTEKPVDESKRYVDGSYPTEYYTSDEEPYNIKLEKRISIVSLLTNIDKSYFNDYPELLLELEDHLEELKFNEEVWKTYEITKGKDKQPTNNEWTYDDPKDWCFQQWVDSENTSKISLIHPFLIAIYKREKGTRKKRTYDRSHPDWDLKEAFWMKQPARNNISVIYHILQRMNEVRDMFYWIYKAETEFPEPNTNLATKAYNEFAGWNDVVVSLAEHNFFTSPSGTLNAVRTANCLEVLELLNWRRGKSFTEYEDHKAAERRRELSGKGKKK